MDSPTSSKPMLGPDELYLTKYLTPARSHQLTYEDKKPDRELKEIK